MTSEKLQDKNMASLMSPCSVPFHVLRVGDVVILLTSPEAKTRGFVGVLEEVEQESRNCVVRLLDSTDETFILSPEELIPTGKKPQELVAQYKMTDLELSLAVETERSLPDFDLLKKPKVKSTPKSKQSISQLIKGLSAEQLAALGALLVKQAKETHKDGK